MVMEIVNHKLVGVPFKRSPNQSGSVVSPDFIVSHYTASNSAEGAISWMVNPKSSVSAHLHLDKEGNFIQLVEFHKRAYHAGKSEYKGVKDLNYHSIGIEIQNRGLVDGVFEEYTQEQIESFVALSKALVATYPSIKEIVGHEQVALPRGRKIDPGPKFPMGYVNDQVFGSPDPDSKWTTADVNLRLNPSTLMPVIKVMKKGTEVKVIWEGDGWAEVIIKNDNIKGWVSSKYIK